jgi:hypothetical protein
MTSIIDPAILLEPDRPSPALPSHTAMEGRLAADHMTSGPSTASKIASFEVRGSTLVLTLSECVGKAVAENLRNYMVTINGGAYQLPGGTVSYDPLGMTVTLRGVPFLRGDHVVVTVLGLWDQIKNIPRPAVICHAVVPKRPHLRRTVALLIAGGVVVVIIIFALAR